MARRGSEYVCQDCGAVTAKWSGRCAACGSWNSIIEERSALGVAGAPASRNDAKGTPLALASLDSDIPEPPRQLTGMAELDRVTGGGLVPGSALLVGGEPGIGKSTLLLQVSAALAEAGQTAIYISGEEAPGQIRLRAKRLGLHKSPVKIASATNLGDIIATIKAEGEVALVVIDSIQTLWRDGLDSAPGTVSQVRAASQLLIQLAKATKAALILVGHVTKDGQIAGPKVLEHMVDTVLYFEGDQGHNFRILRAVKNRFGPTDEIGVFEMRDQGLAEVENPSEMFLGERRDGTPGAAVFAGIEGTRPVLVEIQALVAPSHLATPRRAVVGWDSNRLAMILAVLDARCGLRFGAHDVYLNVAGGLKISEPAADLAAAAALVSAFSGVALPQNTVYFGEISLSGSIRSVTHMGQRQKEAQKLGFTAAVIPAAGELKVEKSEQGFVLQRYDHLSELTARLLQQSGAAQPHNRGAMVG